MRRTLYFCAALALLCGCKGGDDGIDHSAIDKAQAPLIAAAKRCQGDWSKLTPDEQKLFLDRARGNEGAAKQMFNLMAVGRKMGPPSQ